MKISNGTSVVTEGVADPSVATRIFAPRARNYTLSLFTGSAQVGDKEALELAIDPNQLVMHRILENLRMASPSVRGIMAEYLREYLETSLMVPMVRLPAESSLGWEDHATRRTYPRASHLDLLALPTIEGVFVDPDDLDKE